MSTDIHISISAEKLFTLAGIEFTNSMVTSLIVSGLLIAFAFFVRLRLTRTNKPTGLQNIAEMIVESLYSLVFSITNSHKKAANFFPFIATFFLFIILNNWIGLVPGVGTIGFTHVVESEHAAAPNFSTIVQASEVKTDNTETTIDEHSTEATGREEVHLDSASPTQTTSADSDHGEEAAHTAFVPYLRPGTADLNTTLALALISVSMTQIFGISYLSLGYFKKFFNFSDPIMFYVGLLELVSEFAKILSFAFRLFGNIFAGEVLLVVITALTKVVLPMPFYGLEIFVGFIQAFVFAILSLVFFNMATISHDDH